MSKPTRILLWTIGIFACAIAMLFAWPSLLGLLMGLLLVFAIADYSSRRYRHSVRTFNSALRAICHHDGAIGKVALAFSRSGPLSGPCYEYARRLMMGEDPVNAAVDSRVPLQLQTAVAMQTPAQPDTEDHGTDQLLDGENPELAMVDTAMMPAYAQFFYLTTTAVVTCCVLGFIGVFVVPTLEVMFEEFGLQKLPYRKLFSTAPALWILFALTFIIVIVVPVLNRGHLLGIALPRWIPKMPRPAERQAETLHGLADGIDAGWPLGRLLATGHAISTRMSDRRAFQHAMRLVEQGTDPIQAIHAVGWIDKEEAAWLEGSPPGRMAELLRAIGDQNVRDSQSNLRWTMAVIYPVLVVLLGLSVLAYAVGFFGTLSRLISGLA